MNDKKYLTVSQIDWIQAFLGNYAIPYLLGGIIVLVPVYTPLLRNQGLEPLGALLGIILTVFSLFGDLPKWISWVQRVGSWLVPGIAIGTLLLLIRWLTVPSDVNSSFYAFSPLVWGAYISIVAVSVSFEQSSLPAGIYHYIRSRSLSPVMLIPLYIIIVGLLGNLFDGVTIIAISVVIFLALLPRDAAIESSFALLFGGLISNLITVAAEPTNIKFQDVLGSLLDTIHPSYWFTNWPISVFGILFPSGLLWMRFRSQHVAWLKTEEDDVAFAEDVSEAEEFAEPGSEVIEGRNDAAPVSGKKAMPALPSQEGAFGRFLAIMAMSLLAMGIILHSITEVLHLHMAGDGDYPLWIFLAPAGIFAVFHLISVRRFGRGITFVKHELPVWGRLMLIFSLIWFLSYRLTATQNVFASFFTWPDPLRYGSQVILSLLSAITDNVAIAGMQGAIITNHPLAIWQIRLLFILLTWSGGLTYFGCLQSLALNGRLHLQSPEWFKRSIPWAITSIIGGIAGLALILVLYPH